MKTWTDQHKIMSLHSLVEEERARAETATEKEAEMEQGGAVEAPAVVIIVMASLWVMEPAVTVLCTV